MAVANTLVYYDTATVRIVKKLQCITPDKPAGNDRSSMCDAGVPQFGGSDTP